MYQNKPSYHRNRPGVRHFGPNSRPKRGAKPSVNPERFIKAATPELIPKYTATHEFADFEMHPLLKANVTVKGYIRPSEIQDKTIALGLAGKDVIGIANTGTGKTAAFALPVLNSLMRHPGTSVLIIAPTRELAIQIETQFKILAKSSGLRHALLIGGSPMGRQLHDLSIGAQIIIGTPGRIKDHLSHGKLNLDRCQTVVLDEVDRMLDMGFVKDVRFILAALPAQRQSFFFSATMRPEISELIHTFAREPEIINVKQGETSQNVNQGVVRFNDKTHRMNLLRDILNSPDVTKAIIFGRTKYGVERLSKDLVGQGFRAGSIHGGKTQGNRNRTLDSFRSDQIKILVATDVAARGIDIRDISHVINFDAPETYDDYVHRIGRAGRRGEPGHALTFVENSPR